MFEDYGLIPDKPTKIKLNGNCNFDVKSLYPSIIMEIDKSCITDEYQDKDGTYVVEVDGLKIKSFEVKEKEQWKLNITVSSVKNMYH